MIILKNLIPELLVESKQSIINLGYPEIIAKLFYEKFGSKAYILSRWMREYHGSYKNDKDWFLLSFKHMGKLSLYDYVKLYELSFNKPEYLKFKKQLELSDEDVDDLELVEQRAHILSRIKDLFFENMFFKWYDLIKDIISGKITNLSQYDKLSFNDAVKKYEEKKLFVSTRPIKTYSSGFKWIDAGQKCSLMGKYMKNCGSSGVMSSDVDRSLIGLFDTNNKPHVICTYSPNEKRISGVEGIASTPVKDEYADYVIDLIKTLNVFFDPELEKSKIIKLKYYVGDAGTVERLVVGKYQSEWDEFFKIKIGQAAYCSDGFTAVSKEDIAKARAAVKNKSIKLRFTRRNLILDLYNLYNQELFKSIGIEYKRVNQLKT
jgi:hypothetical protein